MDAQRHAPFEPYLPRLVRDWAARTPAEPWRELDGSLVSVDLSGFTALAERLQAKGRAGAEELVLAISGVFEGLIGIANRRGGDVLKFRGDALLILFSGDAHAERACRAASEMQWFIERTGETMSSVGEVKLRMATGIYSGTCHFFLVESSHRELMVAGPAATATIRLEDEADAGEVLVSPATAAAVGPEWLAGERGGAALLALDREPDAAAPPVVEDPDLRDAAPDLEPFVPVALRSHLRLEAGEAEHRQVTAAFLKFTGVEALLAQGGPAALSESLVLARRARGRRDVGPRGNVARVGHRRRRRQDLPGRGRSVEHGSRRGADAAGSARGPRRRLRTDAPGRASTAARCSPATSARAIAVPTRSWATPSISLHASQRGPSRGRSSLPRRCSNARRPASRPQPQPFLVKGKERAVTAYSVGAVTGVAEEERAQELPIVGRESELAELEAAVAAARLRQGQVAELVGEPGIGKSRLVEELKTMAVGFTQLVARCDQYGMSVPYLPFRSLLRPLAGITDAESAAEAGERLKPWVEAVMPDFAPWLPLLAIPFDAEVPMTPETEEIEPAFRRERVFRTVEEFLLRVLVMPTLIVFEDTHWIDDASHGLLLHLVRSSAPAALAPGDHAPAPGLAFPRRAGERSQAARAFGAPGRSDCAARAGSGRRGRALRGAARRGLGALGRQSALRARARQRLPRRRRSRGASGDGRDADHHPDRHARAGRSLPPSQRLGPRGPLRARPPGRRPRRRARGCRRPRPLAATRGVRGLGRDERAAVPARPLPDGRLRGPLLPPPARDPRTRRHRARAARRAGPRRARAPALAPLPACGGLRAGLALLRARSASWPSAAPRTSTPPSCSSGRSRRPSTSSCRRSRWRTSPRRSETSASSRRGTRRPGTRIASRASSPRTGSCSRA